MQIYKKLKIRSKLLMAFFVPLMLTLVIFVAVYESIGGLVETADWVTHTQKVISEGKGLGKLIVDLETGERGFLITGNESFLEPFNETTLVWNENIEKLKELVAGCF